MAGQAEVLRRQLAAAGVEAAGVQQQVVRLREERGGLAAALEESQGAAQDLECKLREASEGGSFMQAQLSLHYHPLTSV